MPQPAQLFDLLRPAAAEILAADADGIAKLQPAKDALVLLDAQPVAAALANYRRAVLGTAMRTTIAPKLNWALRPDHVQAGAYEWEVGDGVVLRLSKTTPEGRQNAMLAAIGLQHALFDLPHPPKGNDDVVLLRLQGSALGTPTIDVASINARGRVEYSYDLVTIAKTATEQITTTQAPRTPVELPDHAIEKQHRDGTS